MTSLEDQGHIATFPQDLIREPIVYAFAYLLYLALAEIVTVLVHLQAGVILHLVGLFLLLLHATYVSELRQHRFLLGLALAPLIRIVSLSLPLFAFAPIYQYLLTSLPLFAVTAFLIYRLDMGRGYLRIHRTASLRSWWLQICIGFSGLLLGFVEYLILRPQPLVPSFTLTDLWVPALILLFSTGYLEELIFRYVVQRTTVEQLGRLRGILYVAIIFTILHTGYRSLADSIFVFAVGLAFGLLVERTNNLVGVTLAHGLTNITLFLVMPFWAAGLLPLPTVAQLGLPDTDVQRAPETRRISTGVGDPRNGNYPDTPWSSLLETETPTIIITNTPRIVDSSTATEVATTATQSRRTRTPQPSSMNVQPSATLCSPRSDWVSYAVRTNDTLYAIARRYSLTAAQLQAANCLYADDIYVGQILYVPFATQQPSPTPQPPTNIPPTPTTRPQPTMANDELPYPTATPQPTEASPEPTAQPDPTDLPPSPTTLPPTPTPPLSIPPTPTPPLPAGAKAP